jgi:hypothetical protein
MGIDYFGANGRPSWMAMRTAFYSLSIQKVVGATGVAAPLRVDGLEKAVFAQQ